MLLLQRQLVQAETYQPPQCQGLVLGTFANTDRVGVPHGKSGARNFPSG